MSDINDCCALRKNGRLIVTNFLRRTIHRANLLHHCLRPMVRREILLRYNHHLAARCDFLLRYSLRLADRDIHHRSERCGEKRSLLLAESRPAAAY
jgi:hypothetical protein